MDVDGTTVLVCNCGETMAIDGDTLSKACGAKTGCSSRNISLSVTIRRDLAAAMLQKDHDKALLIACTQETAVFETIAQDNGCSVPATVNIRELAGWSDESIESRQKWPLQ